jgi:hypothetical protein
MSGREWLEPRLIVWQIRCVIEGFKRLICGIDQTLRLIRRKQVSDDERSMIKDG